MKEDFDLFLLALIQCGLTTAYRMQTAAGIRRGPAAGFETVGRTEIYQGIILP